MKGYYKNWYQHYLAVEKQKERDEQRGYYANLAQEQEMSLRSEKIKHVPYKKENDDERVLVQMSQRRPQKNKFGIVNFLLPMMTVSGFVFLWYQLDIGPLRSLTHDVLVLTGIRENVVDVVSYHLSLLDQHTAFAEKIAAYVIGEDETDFESLQLIYDEIRGSHLEVTQVSGDHYEEVMRLWSFKLYSMSRMMKDLVTNEDLQGAYEQFVHDQAEIASMIRIALEAGSGFEF